MSSRKGNRTFHELYMNLYKNTVSWDLVPMRTVETQPEWIPWYMHPSGLPQGIGHRQLLGQLHSRTDLGDVGSHSQANHKPYQPCWTWYTLAQNQRGSPHPVYPDSRHFLWGDGYWFHEESHLGLRPHRGQIHEGPHELDLDMWTQVSRYNLRIALLLALCCDNQNSGNCVLDLSIT